jgi:hypothetical protein
MASKYNTFKPALGYHGKVFTLYRYQIETQAKLLKKIQSALPDHLSSHALYCVLSNKKVSVYTDSAAWSSQLRFYHRTMLQALLSTHEGVIETLQIKVIPPSIEKEPEQKQTKNIPSTENIDFILDQAEHQSNEKLKNALLKLGKTFQKKSKERSQNKLSS